MHSKWSRGQIFLGGFLSMGRIFQSFHRVFRTFPGQKEKKIREDEFVEANKRADTVDKSSFK